MNKIVTKLVDLFENISRNRTSKELLALTDSRLKDIGLSRYKLEQGAAAYPWKINQSAVVIDFSNLKKAKVGVVVNSQQENAAA